MEHHDGTHTQWNVNHIVFTQHMSIHESCESLRITGINEIKQGPSVCPKPPQEYLLVGIPAHATVGEKSYPLVSSSMPMENPWKSHILFDDFPLFPFEFPIIILFGDFAASHVWGLRGYMFHARFSRPSSCLGAGLNESRLIRKRPGTFSYSFRMCSAEAPAAFQMIQLHPPAPQEDLTVVSSCLSAFEVRTQRLQWAQSGRKWRVNDFRCENGHQNGSKWPLSLGKWKWTSWFLQMSMDFPSIFRQTYLMTSGLSLQQAGREWSGTKPKLGNDGLHKRHCLWDHLKQ